MWEDCAATDPPNKFSEARGGCKQEGVTKTWHKQRENRQSKWKWEGMINCHLPTQWRIQPIRVTGCRHHHLLLFSYIIVRCLDDDLGLHMLVATANLLSHVGKRKDGYNETKTTAIGGPAQVFPPIYSPPEQEKNRQTSNKQELKFQQDENRLPLINTNLRSLYSFPSSYTHTSYIFALTFHVS